MDPRYMDMAPQGTFSGLKNMQNLQYEDQYKTRGLFELINLLHLANPKLDKKELLMQMLQRDLDVDLNNSQFSTGAARNQLEMQQRQQHGAPPNMPFTPGSLWM